MSVRSSSERVAAFHMFVSADVLRRADDSFCLKRLVLAVSVVSEGPVLAAPILLSSAPLNGPIFSWFQGPKKGPIICVKRAPSRAPYSVDSEGLSRALSSKIISRDIFPIRALSSLRVSRNIEHTSGFYFLYTKKCPSILEPKR